jgi:hypothetical protein
MQEVSERRDMQQPLTSPSDECVCVCVSAELLLGTLLRGPACSARSARSGATRATVAGMNAE